MQKRNAVTILFVLLYASAASQPAEKIVLSSDKQWYYPGESMWLSLHTLNACNDSIAQNSSVAYVDLIGGDSKPILQAKVKIENGSGGGRIVISETITSGDYVLLAYTNWMKNFGEESFARKKIHIVNPAKPGNFNASQTTSLPTNIDAATGAVRTGRNNYNNRQKVSATISGLPSARAIVSVQKVDELEKGSGGIFLSQVAAPCEGMRRVPAEFEMEKRGHYVMARVTDKQSYAPAAGITGFLSILNSPDEIFVASSDSSGMIKFHVSEIAGNTELVLQVDGVVAGKYTIELVSPNPVASPMTTAVANDNIFETRSKAIDDALISAQVQKVFSARSWVDTVANNKPAYPFYGKADAFYLMSDYVHFSTVEEILREYVTTVNVQKRDGKLYPLVNDVLSAKPFPDVPLILINGVPIFDLERFMSLNTDEFHSMAVVARKFFVGEKMFYGIIDIRLNVPLKEFGANARVVDYSGTLPAFNMPQPDYDKNAQKNSRIPDFRNVLYWNSGLKTDAQGKASIVFYTGDLEGDYVINITMITEDGKMGTADTKFTIDD